MQGQQEIPLRSLVTKKVVNVGGGQNQETTKTRGESVKKPTHFVDWYHQFPEEPLVKRIMGVTSLGAVSLVLKAAEQKSTSGLMQDPKLTTEQSQIVPDTQEVIPEGITSLVDWINATEACVYPERGDCSTHPINAKWDTPDEAAEMLPMQAMWD